MLNALLGRPLMPMDIVPTTAAIWNIQLGEEERVVRVTRSGERQVLDSDPGSLKRLGAEGDLPERETHHIEVVVPQLAAGDVVVIDTPGVNDINQQRAEITYGYLGAADVAVMVLDASSPFTRTETEFIQGQLLSSTLERMVFVLNKVDRLDEEDLEDAVDFAEERLQELVPQAPPIVPIASKAILEAITTGRPDVADQWGWADLLTVLRQVASDAGTAEARANSHLQQAQAILQSLRMEIAQELSLMETDETAQGAELQKFESGVTDRESRLTLLLNDAKRHGSERLKTMLTMSMQRDADRYVDELEVRISGMGDVGQYAQNVLPRELQLFSKRWFEKNQPNIERFTSEFGRHLVREYQRHFGEELHGLVAAPSVEGTAQLVNANGHAPDDNGNAVLEAALPAAAYLGLAFLGAGPFAIVGLVGGGLLSKHVGARRRESEKQQLVATSRHSIGEVLAEPLGLLHGAVDKWFARVEQVLRSQFEQSHRRVLERFETARSLSGSNSLGERKRALHSMSDSLDDLEAQWRSTSST